MKKLSCLPVLAVDCQATHNRGASGCAALSGTPRTKIVSEKGLTLSVTNQRFGPMHIPHLLF